MAAMVSVVYLAGCASQKNYNPAAKYSPAQLQQDFDIAWQTYQRNHPSYDWYTPKDSVDARFARVRASLTDSLSDTEFRIRLSFAVAGIRCGHTSVSASKAANRYAAKHKETSFPLSVKVWGQDSMVVLQNLLPMKDTLGRGSIIKTINGVPAQDLIRQMKEYVSPDGYSETFREQVVSGAFASRFKMLYGLQPKYKVEYTDTTGQFKTAVIGNFIPRDPGRTRKKTDTDSGISRAKPALPDSKPRTITRRPPSYGSFNIDSSRQFGVLTLNTFTNKKLRKLFRETFRSLKQESIPTLVIDLRSNGGGRIRKSTLLAKYLSHQPFRIADSISAAGFRFPHARYVEGAFWYQHFSWVFGKKMPDGRRHIRNMEKEIHKPKQRLHFDGTLYVVSGGYTFSASTMFISALHGRPKMTIAGEESGGGARGNSSVMTPMITLPNTKLRARLPLFRVITRQSLPHNGRGIMPDVHIPPNSWHMARGLDPKVETLKQMILAQKENKSAQNP